MGRRLSDGAERARVELIGEKMKTRILKGAEINKWHLIDATGQVLGRLAVKIGISLWEE